MADTKRPNVKEELDTKEAYEKPDIKSEEVFEQGVAGRFSPPPQNPTDCWPCLQ